MQNIDDCIKEVWNVEQEILDVIHDICIEQELQYTLIFGTLLGAVRHGGFIPWDDDIDIMMPRKDYEKLISIWNDVAPKGYILQNKRTDSDFTQNFTKIRKDHTTFIQEECEKTKKYHTGIFVDIFPVDRVAPKGILRTVQYIASAVNLLTARGHSSGNKGLIGLIEKIILSLPKKMQLGMYHSTEKIIAYWDKKVNLLWYSPNTIEVCKRYFSSNMFVKMKIINFNSKEYLCANDTHELLTSIYGDYMKLPPEEDRFWKHHPIIVDFEHNYNEIEGRGKK